MAHNIGALDRGVPMSHVDFKKPQCRISLLLIFHNVTCRIKNRPCRMSLYFTLMSHSLSPMSHVEFRNCHVALSILGAKGYNKKTC